MPRINKKNQLALHKAFDKMLTEQDIDFSRSVEFLTLEFLQGFYYRRNSMEEADTRVGLYSAYCFTAQVMQKYSLTQEIANECFYLLSFDFYICNIFTYSGQKVGKFFKGEINRRILKCEKLLSPAINMKQELKDFFARYDSLAKMNPQKYSLRIYPFNQESGCYAQCYWDFLGIGK